MIIKKIFLIFFMIFFYNMNLQADIIYLKNGEKIEGKVTVLSKTKVKIDQNGKSKIIEIDEIEEIIYHSINGEKIEEKVMEETKTKFKIDQNGKSKIIEKDKIEDTIYDKPIQQQDEKNIGETKKSKLKHEDQKKEKELYERKKSQKVKKEKKSPEKDQLEHFKSKLHQEHKEDYIQNKKENFRNPFKPVYDYEEKIIWSALFFPGLGHIYLKQYKKAFLWGGLFWYFVYTAYQKDQQALRTINEYYKLNQSYFYINSFYRIDSLQKAIFLNEIFAKRVKSYSLIRERDMFINYALGVYFFQIISVGLNMNKNQNYYKIYDVHNFGNFDVDLNGLIIFAFNKKIEF